MEVTIWCPGCGQALKARRSELRRDMNFSCTDCGVQVFFRGNRGLSRVMQIRKGQGVFYRWVICGECKIAVNQDRLISDSECPGCGQKMIHGLDGTEEYSEEEVNKWKCD